MAPFEPIRDVVTGKDLAADLAHLGLVRGDIVCVHVGMHTLGWVCGGAQTVVSTLLEAIGHTGTLMMPTYSGDMSDPAKWGYPPAPPDLIETIRQELPAYDPARTPTKNMGCVPELFRTWPGVIRSPHPQSSFAAFGPDATRLASEHPLSNRFGPDSPLGKLMAFRGKILLLGAPYNTLSFFYLSQHFMDHTTPVCKSSPMMVDGRRRWVAYDDIEYPNHWFSDGVQHLIQKGIARLAMVGHARSVLIHAKEAFDEIVLWRKSNNI